MLYSLLLIKIIPAFYHVLNSLYCADVPLSNYSLTHPNISNWNGQGGRQVNKEYVGIRPA